MIKKVKRTRKKLENVKGNINFGINYEITKYLGGIFCYNRPVN